MENRTPEEVNAERVAQARAALRDVLAGIDEEFPINKRIREERENNA